jgi:acyl-CoA synthetase (NDP forming)
MNATNSANASHAVRVLAIRTSSFSLPKRFFMIFFDHDDIFNISTTFSRFRLLAIDASDSRRIFFLSSFDCSTERAVIQDGCRRNQGMTNENLKNLFSPRSIAVIGASNSFDKLGYHVMKSLAGNYSGNLFPVNPKAEKIWDIDSYPSLKEIPGSADLAVIVIPAAFVAETVRECGQKGVKGIVLITAGFKEIEDTKGEVLERELRIIADNFSIPILGPNTFGYVNLTLGINASFTSEFSQLEKGGVALISQSGGVCHLCGFLAIDERVAMSKLMSLGNRCNVDFPEMLRYLIEEDEATNVVALYIEGLDKPRDLIETAASFRGRKPIIAYKAGRSEKSDSASRFHTGSLAGNHEIWTGALKQAGILQVESADELLDTAKALDACALPMGSRVAVLSGQAGPGMIASDALERVSLHLSSFSRATQEKIDRLLPPIAIRTNPVDMGPAWYNPRAMLEILEAAVEDEGTDGVIFLAMYASANLKLAEDMDKYIKTLEPFNKPVIACFTAPPGIWTESIRRLDRQKGLIILPTPERSAKAMSNLWKARLLWGKGR